MDHDFSRDATIEFALHLVAKLCGEKKAKGTML